MGQWVDGEWWCLSLNMEKQHDTVVGVKTSLDLVIVSWKYQCRWKRAYTCKLSGLAKSKQSIHTCSINNWEKYLEF